MGNAVSDARNLANDAIKYTPAGAIGNAITGAACPNPNTPEPIIPLNSKCSIDNCPTQTFDDVDHIREVGGSSMEMRSCPAQYEGIEDITNPACTIRRCKKNVWNQHEPCVENDKKQCEALTATGVDNTDKKGLCCIGFYNDKTNCNPDWKNTCDKEFAHVCKNKLLYTNETCKKFCDSPNGYKECSAPLQEFCTGDNIDKIDICKNAALKSNSIDNNIVAYCENDNNLINSDVCVKRSLNSDLLDKRMEEYCDKADNFLSERCKSYCNYTDVNGAYTKRNTVCDKFVPTHCKNKVEQYSKTFPVGDKHHAFDTPEDNYCSCYVNLEKVIPGIDSSIKSLNTCFYSPCSEAGYQNTILDKATCPKCVNISNINAAERNTGNINVKNVTQICKVDETIKKITDNSDPTKLGETINAESDPIDNFDENNTTDKKTNPNLYYIGGGIGGLVLLIISSIIIIIIIIIIIKK